MAPRALSEDQVHEFRDELCRVAERLFSEQGFEGVTLRALANELGCSPMTPYRYFENKAAIFDAVREAAFQRFGDRIEATARRHRDPLTRLRAMTYAYIGFAFEDPRAYRIMFELEKPTEPTKPLLHGWDVLVGTLGECVAQGQLEGEPVTLAHLAWLAMHGLVTLELSGKLILGHSHEELVEPMLQSFLRGAGAPPAALEKRNTT